MRLFIALEMPDPVRRHLAAVQQALRPAAPGVSWTREPNLHLTLKFLGEVPDPQIPHLCDALKTANSPRLTLAATGMECFAERGRIRVIGAKVDATNGDIRPLRSLVNQIEDLCLPLGFRKERRAYRPHITLARAREPLPASARDRFDEHSATLFPGPSARVEQFALIHSKLDPRGSQYTPLAHFPLTDT